MTDRRRNGFDTYYAEEDLVLMTQIALGNVDAFQTVLELYSLPVFHFTLSILQDKTLSEDITQETCIKLWHHASKWEPQGRIKSWLFRIAHNLCIDEIRRRKPQIDIDTFSESLVADQQSTLQSMHESEVSRTVKTALGAIPVRQRAALMLVHYDDCTNIEGAQIMGVSVDAFESLLSRGRRALRDQLTSHKDKLWEG